MSYPSIEQTVGNTPLVRLQRLPGDTSNTVLAKLEGNNPAGSVKDRPALNMIQRAEARGEISPGDTLIEATSGNTGIALAMAASMGVGLLTVLLSPEPVAVPRPAARDLGTWLRQALVEPFAQFITTHRWNAVLILALIGIYRISDVVMGIMANPFYVDMGYTKEQVAAVSKIFGVIMTLLGAFVGGVLSLRFGIMRILMLGAILSAASNLLFAWLAGQPADVTALMLIVSADNLAGGIASAAFIAYLSSLTQVQYSATQYALFSSLMLLAPKWLAGFSGVFVDAHGYPAFFTATALLGVPVLLLIYLAARIERPKT